MAGLATSLWRGLCRRYAARMLTRWQSGLGLLIALGGAVAWSIALIVIFAPLAVSKYRRTAAR